MTISQRLKQRLKRKLRTALGTQEILDALGPGMELLAVGTHRMYERLLDPTENDATLGFDRASAPCLIEMNGDVLWLPGDLLPFIWHTHVGDTRTGVPRFLAETEHYVWIRDRLMPGQVAFDCGANMGWFTCMMAQAVGRTGSIHAFEPGRTIFLDFERVLKMNEIGNVVGNNQAVADKVGRATFHEISEPDVRREASRLSTTLADTVTLAHDDIQVDTITVDAYATERAVTPQLIKIDVEGAEFLVLEGATKVLQTARPKLVIEVHPDAEGHFDNARLDRLLDGFHYHHEQIGKIYYCD